MREPVNGCRTVQANGIKNKQIVKISGVVHDENAKPTFFKIEYFRAKTSASILVDVYEIELDEYLDTISNNEIYIK